MFLNTLSILLTERCNLACRYCYQQRYPRDLDEKKLKKALDVFFCFPPQDKNIILTGGEPLLKFDLVKKAINYIRQKEKQMVSVFNLSLITNGTLLDKKKINFLMSKKVKIILSLDGSKKNNDKNRIFPNQAEKSCFDQVIKNLSGVSKDNLDNFGVSLVFDRKNFKKLFKNLMYLRTLGFKQIDFFPQLQEIWAAEELKELSIIFEQIAEEYVELFCCRKKLFIIPSLCAFLQRSYLFKGTSCSRISLDAEGGFYLACQSFLSLPLSARRKYKIGDCRQGFNFKRRLKYLNKATQIVNQNIKFQSAKERQLLPFCFFNAVYGGNQGKVSTNRQLANIRNIAKIYLDFFMIIRRELLDKNEFVKFYDI